MYKRQRTMTKVGADFSLLTSLNSEAVFSSAEDHREAAAIKADLPSDLFSQFYGNHV